eukprot:TRINITY_DN19263_c0_g1_i1.p1 TRINITY_DN19263_c0_g1~~TRINITY_DN19263_c0_g1_i1.p1  ORF type:complete len:428 (-),score=52.03 TRINITY_DN19263_c0_g1_i1:198-1481(-)
MQGGMGICLPDYSSRMSRWHCGRYENSLLGCPLESMHLPDNMKSVKCAQFFQAGRAKARQLSVQANTKLRSHAVHSDFAPNAKPILGGGSRLCLQKASICTRRNQHGVEYQKRRSSIRTFGRSGENEGVESQAGRGRTQTPNSSTEVSQKEEIGREDRASRLPPSAQPTDIVVWGGTLPPTRRLVTGGLLAASIVLGGNLGGVTSLLLGLQEEWSRDVRADVLFPVKGFKRCVESSWGFEFIYPARWVGDQRLVYRAVERAERERTLDLPSLRIEQARARRRTTPDPVVAFGPPGSEGELNVSVVAAPVLEGFTLEKLGTPTVAAERILSTIIAPAGSNKEAILLSASSRERAGVLYYTAEYTVQGSSFFRHNLSVYATMDDILFSFNAQSPESGWETAKDAFVTMGKSFAVTGDGRRGVVDVPRNL